jgi:hypothetical protein
MKKDLKSKISGKKPELVTVLSTVLILSLVIAITGISWCLPALACITNGSVSNGSAPASYKPPETIYYNYYPPTPTPEVISTPVMAPILIPTPTPTALPSAMPLEVASATQIAPINDMKSSVQTTNSGDAGIISVSIIAAIVAVSAVAYLVMFGKK